MQLFGLHGCPIHCEGCFNSSIWDPKSGKPLTPDRISVIEEELDKDWCKGISILGGEPLADWNIDATRELTRLAWKRGKDAWVWTGFLFENLTSLQLRALDFTDYLVDRPIY